MIKAQRTIPPDQADVARTHRADPTARTIQIRVHAGVFYGRPDPDAVPRFLASHPAGRAFVERLMKKPVPASYAQVIYHAEHAFRFTAADGTSRFGRYRFVPQAGEGNLGGSGFLFDSAEKPHIFSFVIDAGSVSIQTQIGR